MRMIFFVILVLIGTLFFIVLFLPGFPFGNQLRTVNPNVTLP